MNVSRVARSVMNVVSLKLTKHEVLLPESDSRHNSRRRRRRLIRRCVIHRWVVVVVVIKK